MVQQILVWILLESLSLLLCLIGVSLDLENCVENFLPLDPLELDGLGELLREILLLSAVEGTAELPSCQALYTLLSPLGPPSLSNHILAAVLRLNRKRSHPL